MLVPGKKIKLFINDANPNNKIYHIRAIVDDEYIVYKVWSRSKQRWNYHIDWFYLFEMYLKNGWLTKSS